MDTHRWFVAQGCVVGYARGGAVQVLDYAYPSRPYVTYQNVCFHLLM